MNPRIVITTPDRDRLEALLSWLYAHLRMAMRPDELVTLEGRASGLLEIIGALRQQCGDVQWFPTQRILGAPPTAMVALQVRAGDLGDMIGALEQVLERMRRVQ